MLHDLKDKFQKRILVMGDFVNLHRDQVAEQCMLIKSMHEAQPGEGQTTVKALKFLYDEIIRLKAADQDILDEARVAESCLRNDYSNQVSVVSSGLVQTNGQLVKVVGEIEALKLIVTAPVLGALPADVPAAGPPRRQRFERRHLHWDSNHSSDGDELLALAQLAQPMSAQS